MKEFHLECRQSRAGDNSILDFHWVDLDALVLVTNYGIELYRVVPDKATVKSLKNVNQAVTWSTYLHDARLLLLYGGVGVALQGFQIQLPALSTLKLPRFELEVTNAADKSRKNAIRPSDILLARMYERTYCLHLHVAAAEIVLYQLGQDVVIKAHKISLLPPGVSQADHSLAKLAVSIVDHCLVVHDGDRKKALLFDIKTSTRLPVAADIELTVEADDNERALAEAEAKRGARRERKRAKAEKRVKAAAAKAKAKAEKSGDDDGDASDATSSSSDDDEDDDTDDDDVSVGVTPTDATMYDAVWQFESPNFVLDPTHGRLWNLKINLDEITAHANNKIHLVQFLLRRSKAHTLVLDVVRGLIADRESLATIAKVFDILNNICRIAKQESQASPAKVAPKKKKKSWWSFDSSSSDTKRRNSYNLPDYKTSSAGDAPPASPKATAKSLATDVGRGSDPHAAAAEAAAAIDAVMLNPGRSTVDDDDAASEATSSVPGSSVATGGSSSLYSDVYIINGPPKREGGGASVPTSDGYTVIDQADMYTYVFSVIEEQSDSEHKYLLAILMEYIRSLSYYSLRVEHFIYQFLINLLVKHSRFYQLHQFLQYHVVADSRPVAFQLLSLEKVYQPCYQLALDMLNRLHAADEIVHVLLSRGHVLDAFKFAMAHKPDYPAKHLLQAAHETGDRQLFFTVFDQWDRTRRANALSAGTRTEPATDDASPTPLSSAGSLPSGDDQCEEYVKLFNAMFNQDRSIAAQ